MSPKKQPAKRVGSAGAGLMLGGNNSDHTEIPACEQARAAERQSTAHLRLARTLPGLMGAQALALASYYGRRARQLMEAAHG